MQNDNEAAEIAKEHDRIGIQTGERLPFPRFVKSNSDYLTFLKGVPDASGVRGFWTAMSEGRKRA